MKYIYIYTYIYMYKRKAQDKVATEGKGKWDDIKNIKQNDRLGAITAGANSPLCHLLPTLHQNYSTSSPSS
jgi:hypothetical protein